MKEFELQEDHEFFEQSGTSVLPEDNVVDIKIVKEDVIPQTTKFIQEYIKNNRLIAVTITCEFRGDDGICNYVTLEQSLTS